MAKGSFKRSIKAATTGKLKRQMKKAVNPLYGKSNAITKTGNFWPNLMRSLKRLINPIYGKGLVYWARKFFK